MDDIGEIALLPLAVVDQHVDAIRAVVREDVRGEEDTTARALAERLDELVTKTLGDLAAA